MQMRPLRLAVPVLAASLALWPSAQADDLVPFPAQKADVPYPTQEWPELDASDATRAKVDGILDRAFTGERPPELARAKAIIVVQAGRIASERYAEGITRDTRLQSWSTA